MKHRLAGFGVHDKHRQLPLCAAIVFLLSFVAAVPSVAMNNEERLLFANGLYRRDLFELAITEYNALLADTTATNLQDIATFRIGECYRMLGNTNEAAAAYEKVATYFPRSSFSHRAAFRRAEIDWLAGRQKDAMQKFQQLIALKPEEEIEAAALYHLGLCQIGLDLTGDAEKSLNQMVKTHPASPYADYARLALADVLTQSDPTSAKASELLMAVADEPESPALGAEALAKAALLSYRANNPSEAALRFASLSTRFPDNEWTIKTRLESGWSHLLAGQIDTARALAGTGVDTASEIEKPAWLYLLANIERQAGANQKAAQHYDELLKIAPGHELASIAAFEACGVAWQLEQHQRVLELIEPARGPADRELPLLWMEAGAFQSLGNTEKAVLAYEKITRDHAASDRAPYAAYQLALITEQKGDLSTAAEAFAAVATNFAGHVIAPDAMMASASAWQRAGKAKQAAAAWGKLIEATPDYAAIDEAHMGRARAEIELDKTTAAAKSLQAVIAVSTNQSFLAEAHYLRGTLLEKDEKLAEAEQHYTQALTFNPTASLARQIQFRLVAVLQLQNRNEEAADLMNTLIAGGSGNQLPPTLLEWLARWNLEKKLYPEAEVAATLLANQGDTPGWKLLGYFIAGTAAREQKKTAEAIAAFEQAAAVGLNARENAEAYYQLGELALETKRPAEAITYFSQAAERAGSDTMMDIRARSYLHLGIAHEALEQWAEASRFYLSVGVLFDDQAMTPESLYRAAGALHAQQQTTQRDRVIAELKQRFPDTEWSRKAGERW